MEGEAAGAMHAAHRACAAAIDDAACIAAANACDASISLTEGTTTITGAQYTCNGAFSTAGSREEVLGGLLEAMAGTAVYGARWRILAGAWTVPVLDLSDDDLHGQIEVVQAGAGIDDIFNGVRGNFVPAGSGVSSDFDPYQNATFVAADGAELWTDVSLPWTDSRARCRNIARILTERMRDSQVIRYPAKLKAWPLEVGDRVRVSSAEYGWTLKTFAVTDWQFGLSAPVTLTLQEDSAAAYDLADAATADPNPNTGLADPWAIAPLSGLAADSGDATLQTLGDGTVQPRVLLTWSPVADAYVANGSGRIEVTWRRPLLDAANTWQTVGASGSDTSTFIVGVGDGDVLTIGATAINSLGARSATVYIQHTVVGLRAPPGPVQGFAVEFVSGGARFFWQRSTAPNYDGTEIHFEGTWAAATAPVWRGKATEWFLPWPASGAYSVLAKHRSSGSLYSAVAARITFTVTGQIVTDCTASWYTDGGEAAAWLADVEDPESGEVTGYLPVAWTAEGPIDMSLLWGTVSGPNKPADNATANPVYRQMTAPTGAPDGAIWLQTDAFGVVIASWVREGGVWVQGPLGASVELQYSVDGATAWHSTFATGDLYMRQRVGAAGAWSGAIPIVGAPGANGTNGTNGTNGLTGPTGPRGPVTIAYAITGTAVWSDTQAQAALTAGGYGAPQFFDQVTLYKTSAAFSETRIYSGTAWLTITAYINGNLVVGGTLLGTAFVTDTLIVQSTANLGNATVTTLKIGTEQVLVPRSVSDSTLFTGNNAYQTILPSYSFSLGLAAPVIVLWNAEQGFTSTTTTDYIFRAEFFLNGSLIGYTRGGETAQDSPGTSVFGNGVAGTNTLVVKWRGTPQAQIANQKVVVLGAMR